MRDNLRHLYFCAWRGAATSSSMCEAPLAAPRGCTGAARLWASLGLSNARGRAQRQGASQRRGKSKSKNGEQEGRRSAHKKKSGPCGKRACPAERGGSGEQQRGKQSKERGAAGRSMLPCPGKRRERPTAALGSAIGTASASSPSGREAGLSICKPGAQPACSSSLKAALGAPLTSGPAGICAARAKPALVASYLLCGWRAWLMEISNRLSLAALCGTAAGRAVERMLCVLRAPGSA